MSIQNYKLYNTYKNEIKCICNKINIELSKLPNDYIKTHMTKIYFLGDDKLNYIDDTKNGIFRTHDAILFSKSFPYLKYKVIIKWGCTFRKEWYSVEDVRLYNNIIRIDKLDKVSMLYLRNKLNDVFNSIKEEIR